MFKRFFANIKKSSALATVLLLSVLLCGVVGARAAGEPVFTETQLCLHLHSHEVGIDMLHIVDTGERHLPSQSVPKPLAPNHIT